MERQFISEEDTFLLLSRRDIKRETESEIITAQNQALQINYHENATKILQTETDSICTPCRQFDETVEHITSASPILGRSTNVKRHDRVCAELHFNIRKETGVKLDNERRYDHVTKLAKTSHEVKVTIRGFGGLEVACWPFVPKFAGSNPAEAVGYFMAKKSPASLPSEGK